MRDRGEPAGVGGFGREHDGADDSVMQGGPRLFPDRSGNEFQDLCTMVGLITLEWAWAETGLAATIGIINRYAGPIAGHPQAPVSL